jgi:2-polyprenyl-6-methoxyphenol hydroxylase-like FAD-dependent oxidoreductase
MQFQRETLRRSRAVPSTELSQVTPIDVDVVIVGGGPAGVILANLLVRRNLRVLQLEVCHDFERKFRGDALTPSVLRVLDRMGFMDRVLQLPHAKLYRVDLETPRGAVTVTDYQVLVQPYNYVMVVPQPQLLQLVTQDSQSRDGYCLRFGARLVNLLYRKSRIVGLQYRQADQTFEVNAQLVIGADGRHSKTRELIGEKPLQKAPPMDVLWFSLPRISSDAPSRNLSVSYGQGYYVALTDRQEHWTVAYVMKKGLYRELRQRGIEAFRRSVSSLIPEFEERLAPLDWPEIAHLAPDCSRCPTWHRDGLLLIGDAAHVMSSVGGLGIQTAVQDAVVAANTLAKPLQRRQLTRWHLRWIQFRRWPIVAALQVIQRFGQNAIIARILDPEIAFEVPFYLKSRPVQCLTAWIVGYGLKLELPADCGADTATATSGETLDCS